MSNSKIVSSLIERAALIDRTSKESWENECARVCKILAPVFKLDQPILA